MKCLECQDLLQRRLDGEPIAESTALEQHLNECVACREQHASAAILLEGLKDLPRPRPSAGFAQALASEVIRDRRHRRDKLRRRVFLTVALAASIMMMLVIGYYWMPRPGGLVEIAKDVPRKELPPIKKEIPPDPKTPDPRSPLTPMMDRLADTTRDHAKVVQVAMNLDAVDRLPAVDALHPIDPGVREAGQEVSDGLRTVTRSARKAFDFFARELPMPDMGELKN